MKLEITEEAAQWYKREMNLQDGDFVRIFVKLYGGYGSIHPNYSLGVMKDIPKDVTIQVVGDGITFYFREQDDWYLRDHDLTISLKGDQPDFSFQPATIH